MSRVMRPTPRRAHVPVGPLWLLVLAFALLIVPACGPAGKGQSETPDIAIVPYAPNAIFGNRPAGEQLSTTLLFAPDLPVVLNLWGADCPPCRSEMPAFQAISDQYAGRVVVAGIDIGAFTGLGSHDAARALIDELGIHYPAAYAVDSAVLKTYGVSGLPATLFFAGNGELVEKYQGALTEVQLGGKVERLLAPAKT
jgi:thiol-disulfide isomerase/thioredoxin